MNTFYAAHVVAFQQTVVFGLLALSFQVVLRSGVFSFASVGFYGLGAYMAADLSKYGWPLYPSLVAIIASSAVVGYFISYPFVRLRGLYLGMVTFALTQILVVFADNGGSLTGGANGLFGVQLQIGTSALFIILAVAVVFVSQLERRSLGRSLQLLRSDEQLARVLGSDVVHQRAFVFAISAVLGGLAGALNTITSSLASPTSFGFDLIVSGLTMAVIGGTGSWLGAIIGAIFVVWFPVVFSFVGVYQDIVYGALLMLVVVFVPNGVLGLLGALARSIRFLHGRRVVTAGAGLEMDVSTGSDKVVREDSGV